jgi:hypothetical protein
VSTSILDLEGRPHRGIRKPRGRMSAAERIARNVIADPNGCHLWTARLTNAGYGQFTYSQPGYKIQTLGAHRVAYELAYGRIPAGLVVDHLCRVRRCVNPEHMEAVSPRENVMRSPIAPAAINARKTHCPQGHPYDEENTYVGQRCGRLCRTCTRARQAVSA